MPKLGKYEKNNLPQNHRANYRIWFSLFITHPNIHTPTILHCRGRLCLVTGVYLVNCGQGIWVNPWWGGQGKFGETNPGVGDMGVWGRQPLEARQKGLPMGDLFGPPAPGHQGCLPKLTCPHSPRVASDLFYCNSQTRVKLDDWHSYRGVQLQDCDGLLVI